jgi:hypothetical protein
MQTLDYYRSFPKDHMTLKLFVRTPILLAGALQFKLMLYQVAFLTCLDTVSTVLVMHETWVRVVQGWGSNTALDVFLV